MLPVELIEKRTRNSKTFYLGGNKYCQVFHGGDIHYKDSDGHWQDIDANYSEADGDGFTARFIRLPYAVRIGDDGRRRLYPDRNDLSYWVEIGKPFANMGAPTKEGGYWVWDYPNATVSLRIANTGIKLNFTLKNSNAPINISFPFSTKGITRDGRTLLHNGEPVVILARPYAVDAEGTRRDLAISFGSGEVTLSLDTNGLVFPIDVDPTELVVQPSAKDTLLNEQSPDTNYGGDEYIYLGDAPANVYRSLLELDISELPAGAILVSASLELYFYASWGASPLGLTIWAYKLTRTDWVELQATWNSYKTGSPWTNPGGDYVTVDPVGGSTVVPAGYGWMAWDVLAIVQDASDAGNPVELLVKFENETGVNAWPIFHSKEYATDPDLQPKLTIEYTAPPPPPPPANPLIGKPLIAPDIIRKAKIR